MSIRSAPVYILCAAAVIIAVIVYLRFEKTHSEQGQLRALTIYSTTDSEVFQPVIDDFVRLYPSVEVEYELLDAGPLQDRVISESSQGQNTADIVLSTAMDLQVELVNDGYVAPHVTAGGSSIPDWAKWRDEAFGVTFEPAVIVVNQQAMAGKELPATRADVIQMLRRDKAFWIGRVGTYDIKQSSVGYLLASQDERRISEFGILLDAFGEAGVVTSENTSSLLEKIEAGEIYLGYNLLGSYARARVAAGAPIKIIYPQDYTLAVSRTAVILKNSPHPEEAHAFLEYLLSLRGQQVLSEKTYLNSVREEIGGPYSKLGLFAGQVGTFRPIALGPGLLVYLDPMKQENFLATWDEAIPPASGLVEIPVTYSE